MLGTLSLLATGVIGFLQWPIWWLVPLIVLNNFIGMHTPPTRMQRLKEMGVSYWGFFASNLPLIAMFTSGVYGLGYGLAWVFA